jgi:hypothetical protein
MHLSTNVHGLEAHVTIRRHDAEPNSFFVLLRAVVSNEEFSQNEPTEFAEGQIRRFAERFDGVYSRVASIKESIACATA